MNFFRKPFFAVVMALPLLVISCSKDSSLDRVSGELKSSYTISRPDYNLSLEVLEQSLSGFIDDTTLTNSNSDVYNYVTDFLANNTTIPPGAPDVDTVLIYYPMADIIDIKLASTGFITSAQESLLNDFFTDINNLSATTDSAAIADFESLLDGLESDLNSTGLTQAQANYFGNFLATMQATGRGMQNIFATNGLRFFPCASAALGIFGMAVAIITAPATGGISYLTYSAYLAGSMATGFSIAECFPLKK